MPNTNKPFIADPHRPSRSFHIEEIYDGKGPGRWVPNVNDLIVDYTAGFLRCVHVDYTTGISELIPWVPAQSNSTDLEVFSVGHGRMVVEPFRIFLDTSVTPHAFTIDSAYQVNGTLSKYIRIFKGTNIGKQGEVISKFYDNTGQILGDKIPLEIIAMDQVNNTAIKAPVPGYTLAQLDDGDLVTVVVYRDDGGVSSYEPMRVQNTAWIRSPNRHTRYISNISLESPFLSSSDSLLVQFPINMPVENLNLMGVVTYSDGSRVKLPVDGTKFEIYGLDNYIATEQGQEFEVVLKYNLGEDEFNYISAPEGTRAAVKKYNVSTLRADGSYSVKLFVYPVWVDELSGYRLEAFLYNLNRQRVYNVTSYLQNAEGRRAFEPLRYGVQQEITLAVDMFRVDPAFARYRHAQTFTITLMRPGDQTATTPWSIGFKPGQDPMYGLDLEAKARMINQSNWQMRIDSEIRNFDTWLKTLYYDTYPLYDPLSEIKPPEPNYFAIVVGDYRKEFPIAQWNQVLTLERAPRQGEVTYIQWMRRSNENDLQLGCSGVVTHHYDTI